MDSLTNEPESHGFVTYEVEANENFGGLIENTAHIIFDSNPAIVTNTTKNTLVDSIQTNIYNSITYIGCPGDTILGYTENVVLSDTTITSDSCVVINSTNIIFGQPSVHDFNIEA